MIELARMKEADDLARYFERIRAGDDAAKASLADLVQAELRRMAEFIMRSERPNHTLQPTALVNELYLRLLSGQFINLHDRRHFFAMAAQAMRRILVDHARARSSDKRGGARAHVDVDSIPLVSHDNIEQIVELDQALQRLEKMDARQARVVELRFFAGLSEDEIAQLLGVSVRTVKRDWSMAKAWLYSELGSAGRTGGEPDDDSTAVAVPK
jgi:RNA polymerase sigma factor (TIGR02999 family)